MIIVIILT